MADHSSENTTITPIEPGFDFTGAPIAPPPAGTPMAPVADAPASAPSVTTATANPVLTAVGVPIGADVNVNASGKTAPTKAVWGAVLSGIIAGATSAQTALVNGADFADWQTWLNVGIAALVGAGVVGGTVYKATNRAV